MPRGDVTKLPKWAQQEIERLERDLEHYKAKLSEGPEDSNTFADPYSDARRPLGDSPTIEFILGDGHKIRVRREGLRLDINGDDPLAVRPRASNSIEIEVRR